MATRTAPPKPAGPKGGRKLTIGFGLINVDVAICPLTRSQTISGRTLCAEHLVPIKSAARCTAVDHICEETVVGYEADGGFVQVDTKELEVAGDGRVALESCVDVGTIDPIYLEKTYLLWPQPGAEQAFDLLAKTFRETGRAAIGTCVLSKATRALVIRWSEATGTLVAHVCTYDAAIRWDDVAIVKDAFEARPEAKKAEVETAGLLLGQLEGEFDPTAYADEYVEALAEAIRAAADGKPVKKAAKQAEQPAPSGDIMAALQASLAAASKPKAKANGKGRKKVPA